jgi:hypothetical protein
MRRWAGVVIGVMLALIAPAAQAEPRPFSDWAAVVVAGDWRAHGGGPTEAFDNARRDVAAALVDLGFSKTAIRQYSVRPKRYRNPRPEKSDLVGIYAGLGQLAKTAPGGCLVYLSSHGAPEGALVGEAILTPSLLADLVDGACPDRPSIVVLSACFSGVFVPTLQRRDRMILTAARRDRASFGCGESDKYPFFDDCFLKSAPTAHDFAALGAAVQACVAATETATGASPPSEPQLWIGAGLKPLLPLYAFARPPPRPRP